MANWWYNRISIHLKKPMVIIGFLLLITNVNAQQNLVPNSGFDSVYNKCPNLPFTLYNQKKWCPIATPDVFYYCSSSVSNGIPQNSIGYQYPLSDSIYVGIGVSRSFNVVREFITVKMTEKLEENKMYCGEFYVSLCDECSYAISSLGMYFSTDSVCGSNNLKIDKSQIQNDSLNIITDKQNWVKISGSFVANGGEQFLTIGNFYNDNFTEKHSIKVSNSSYDVAYYYIDNVSVYACDSPLEAQPQDTTFVFIPNVFSPNQDGENDLWQVTANKVTSLNVQVFNRWGEQVYKTNLANTEEPTNFNPAWDGYTPTGKTVPEGTYFYIVQYTLPNGEVKVEKGHLTLIR